MPSASSSPAPPPLQVPQMDDRTGLSPSVEPDARWGASRADQYHRRASRSHSLSHSRSPSQPLDALPPDRASADPSPSPAPAPVPAPAPPPGAPLTTTTTSSSLAPTLTPQDLAQAAHLSHALAALHACKASVEAENRRLREMCGRVLVRVLPALGGPHSSQGAAQGAPAVEGLEDISSMAATMGDEQFAALAGAVASMLPQQAGPEGEGAGAGGAADEPPPRRAVVDPEAALREGAGALGRVVLENMERERRELVVRAREGGLLTADGTLVRPVVPVGSETTTAATKAAAAAALPPPPDLALLQSIHVHLATLLAASRSKNHALKQTLDAARAPAPGTDPARDADDWRTGLEVAKAARDIRGYVESLVKASREGTPFPSPIAHPNPAYSSLAHALPIPLTAGPAGGAAGTTSLPIPLHPAFIPAIYNKRKGRPTRELQESKRAGLRMGLWGAPPAAEGRGVSALEEELMQSAAVGGRASAKASSSSTPAKRGPKPKPKPGGEPTPIKRRHRRAKAEIEAEAAEKKKATPAPASRREKRPAAESSRRASERAATEAAPSEPIISPTAIPYPDPPNPDVPARDPAHQIFSTQIPYQLQMRSMIADGRWPYGDAAGPGAVADDAAGGDGSDMASLLAAASNGQGGQGSGAPFTPQSGDSMHGHEFLTQQQDAENGERSDLLLTVPRNAVNIGDAMHLAHAEGLYGAAVSGSQFIRPGRFDGYQPFQSRRIHKRKRTEDGELSDGAGTTTCPNCGTTITNVWRKLTVGGHDYRVCNACGLHYAKNGVMRPEALWPKAGEAPKKRKHANPRAQRTQPAFALEGQTTLAHEGASGDGEANAAADADADADEDTAAEAPANEPLEDDHLDPPPELIDDEYHFDVPGHEGVSEVDYAAGMEMAGMGFAQQLAYTATTLQHAGDGSQHVG